LNGRRRPQGYGAILQVGAEVRRRRRRSAAPRELTSDVRWQAPVRIHLNSWASVKTTKNGTVPVSSGAPVVMPHELSLIETIFVTIFLVAMRLYFNQTKRCGVYEIEVHEDAIAELDGLKTYVRRAILDAIEEQLSFEPNMPTRKRKVLIGLVPPWDECDMVWQLRVGDHRVFYDVIEEENRVVVRAVRKKPPHKTTDQIL
jgi:mRNA-degrading endonuclease RelE of RelBE toxin-antitoxin system